jgi:hypothetical protein
MRGEIRQQNVIFSLERPGDRIRKKSSDSEGEMDGGPGPEGTLSR